MFDHRLLQNHRYALIDPANVAAIPDEFATLSLLPSGISEESEHLFPRFLPLKSLSLAQRGKLLDILEAQEPEARPLLCALLNSEAEPGNVVAHLKQIQVLKSYRGASVEKSWLRMHDPRVFVQLQRILTDENGVTLFGPILRWTIPFNSEWLGFERPSSPAPAHYIHYGWPMARIADIGVVNRALSRLKIEGYPETIALSKTIEAEIDRARDTYGLIENDDLAEFSFRALVANRFDQHPEIHPLIRDPQDGEDTRLADRLARVSRSVWQRLNA